MSLMEAMALGMPCMVSKIRGNTDLIDTDGGVLFDPYDVESCRNAIVHMLSTDPATMSAHNRIKIQKFSQASVLSMVDLLYKI